MLKKTVYLSILVLLGTFAHASDKPTALFPTMEQINLLRTAPGWGGLQSSCKADLKLASHPVANFSPLPHYGATGPVVENKDAAAPNLSKDSLAVYRLSLCYAISKDNTFSSKAEEILDGWAHTTKQIGSLQGADGFNFSFPYALLGAYLLKQDPSWNSDGLTRFVKEIVVPADNADRPNNHGNWGVLLLVTAGGYLNDEALVHRARQRWQELMRTQVAEDGSLPQEICRSDTSNWCGGPTKGIKGIAYTHYTLYPTTIAAEIFRNMGEDLYSTGEGALLCRAYTRAAAWTLHPETFPYFDFNNGKLDGVHNIDYFYILQRRCSVPDGARVLKDYGAVTGDTMNLRILYGQ